MEKCEKIKEPQELSAGYVLHVKELDFKNQYITFQDVGSVRKDYMEDTEILIGGKLCISGDLKVDVLLENSTFGIPDIEGIIKKFDINIGFFCKIDLDSKIVSIWFSKDDCSTDIDMEIDLGYFPLGLDSITEFILNFVFYCYTEENPLIIVIPVEEQENESKVEEQENESKVEEQEKESKLYLKKLADIHKEKMNLGNLCISNMRGENIAKKDSELFGSGLSDPYVEIEVEENTFETSYISDTQNPVWKEQFNIQVKKTSSSIKFVVKDSDGFMKTDDSCGFMIKRIAKFTKHEGKQSHEFRLVPEGKLYFDTEWCPERDVTSFVGFSDYLPLVPESTK
jgi:hypothetical protein